MKFFSKGKSKEEPSEELMLSNEIKRLQKSKNKKINPFLISCNFELFGNLAHSACGAMYGSYFFARPEPSHLSRTVNPRVEEAQKKINAIDRKIHEARQGLTRIKTARLIQEASNLPEPISTIIHSYLPR